MPADNFQRGMKCYVRKKRVCTYSKWKKRISFSLIHKLEEEGKVENLRYRAPFFARQDRRKKKKREEEKGNMNQPVDLAHESDGEGAK